MALKIAQLGQPVLRQATRPLDPNEINTPALEQFIDDMLATLAECGGLGLAAPQVFASQRLFLAAIMPGPDPEQPPGVEVFINPQIVAASVEKAGSWEGCLSFPELLVRVERPLAVRIEYLNRLGETRALELQGFPARVVQHEYDHLEGILTIDRAVSTHHIIKASEFEAVKEATGP
jgi:peptide deformylase